MQIRFPGMTCVVCGQPLPPGSEAEVHPTLRGPKGGKKYYHSQHGAQGNPKKSALERFRSIPSRAKHRLGGTLVRGSGPLEEVRILYDQIGMYDPPSKYHVLLYWVYDPASRLRGWTQYGPFDTRVEALEWGKMIAGAPEIIDHIYSEYRQGDAKKNPKVRTSRRVHKMSDDEFDRKYEPLNAPSGDTHHFPELDPVALQDGSHIFPYWTAQEIQGQKKNYVWTVLDVDDELYVVPGIHRVNQFAFMVTRKPWKDKNIEVKWT